MPFQLFILNYIFHMHVNSPAWADENQLKCERVRFFKEVGEINPG